MTDTTTPAPATPQAGSPQTPATPAAPTPATAAKAGEGTQPKESTPTPAAPAKVVPEKYDLKVPEGSPLDASHVEKVAALAKERGLSNEEAQAIVDRDNQTISGFANGQQEQFKKQQEVWKEQSSKDSEFGGAEFAKNAELSKRVLERFGSDELRFALDATGLGNHPELIRFVYRIGKMMSEDQLVIPKANTGGQQKSMEEVFYGDKKPQS